MEDSQLMSDQINQPGIPSDPFVMNDTQQPAFIDRQDSAVSPVTPDPNIALLLNEMQHLRQDFEAKVKYDMSKERLIESLHRELQTYREGLHFRVLRPVFTDLITMHDDIGKVINTVPPGSDALFEQLRQTLTMFQEMVEDILRRNGAESFTVEGTAFQPSRQRILRVVPTTDFALDKQIARRVRKGFSYEEIVLRAEVVETYKYSQ